MKTVKSIIVVLFALLTAQIATAFYCPSTGRWLSRDPIGEPGFQALQTSSLPSRIGNSVLQTSGRWVNRDSIKESGGLNLYGCMANNPINQIDLLGLCKIKIRCGPYKISIAGIGVTLGWHCGVVAPDGVEFGIGGAGTSGGIVGTPVVPPVYPDPTQPYPGPGQPTPSQKEYPVSCGGDCCSTQQRIQNYHSTVTPSPYNATGPNSDTYAHNMLKAAGCSVDPIPQPCYTIYYGAPGIPITVCPGPTTTPPGTVAWNYGF